MGMIIMNGKEYASSPKDGFPPIIYSDKEREIGVWRDGKPLYQKTLHFNGSILVNTSGWEPLDSTINGETLVTLSISTLDKRYNESRAITIRHDAANIIPRFQISEGAFKYYTNSQDFPFSGNDYDWNIILQYTKTTDVPGSGKYTTYGGLAHHYSETEQVVGTWIDGKPIYEKAWEFENTIVVESNTWTDTPVSNSTIKGIIGVKGYNLYSGKISCWDGLSATADSGNYVKILHNRNVQIAVKYLILQYTKTTD